MALGMRTEQIFPDSPIVTDAFASPEPRNGEFSGASRVRIGSLTSAFATRPASQPSAESILPLLLAVETATGPQTAAEASARATLVLRHALQWAIERCDVDLLNWLAGLTGDWAVILDAEVAVLEDEEGWGIAGMAIQASCGRQNKEEVVRAVVGRWSLDVGPREGRDRTGWTPLHLAALLSTPPLISFLLTRGASPNATTNRGLTPLDLVAGMSERQQITLLLEQASSHGTSTSRAAVPVLTDGRQNLLKRRRERVAKEQSRDQRREKRSKRDKERERWIREKVEVVDVDPALLFADRESKRVRASQDSGVVIMASDLADDSDGEEEVSRSGDEEHDLSEELVFLPANLPAIYDTIITSYKPVCQPLSARSLPANAIHLYARFALRCDESWLEELLEGAVDRIEHGVYSHIEDLAYLAFWAYNTTLLLHLLASDEPLRTACDELGLLGMIEELINAVHVFVIRVAERRTDMVLDGAILDYETLEDFDDVRFEGEWTLFRTLGTKKQRGSILPKASQVFSDAVSAATNGIESGSPSGLFNSIRVKSPFKNTLQPQASVPSLRQAADTAAMPPPALIPAPADPKSTDSPAKVTDILTGVLVVLQLYDVNPTITVQAFSQIFFWIAAELFNRILTRKKYLCRSKAVQIRMNITALDDWVRLNSLPAKTATQHFEPVLQLLQWLQMQSSINSFDDLIGTVQGLKCLNPLQMRRAVKEYRFEVNEGRMNEECVAYMGQMQRDWENRRVETSVRALQAGRGGSATSSPNPNVEAEEQGRLGTPLDALFDGSTTLADFVPSTGPESFGELLDSRFMLPFQLPDNPAYLVAAPPKDAVYANCLPASPFISDDMSRSGSRSSISLERPFEYALPSRSKLTELPGDFFSWLREQEAERRHMIDVVPISAPATSTPLANGGVLPNPLPLAAMFDPPAPSTTLDSGIPPPKSASRATVQTPLSESSFPSPGLRTSPSMDILRQQSQNTFSPPSPIMEPPKQHFRPESHELRIRRAANTLSASSSALPGPSRSPTHFDSSPTVSLSPPSRQAKEGRPISEVTSFSSNSIAGGETHARNSAVQPPLSPTDSTSRTNSAFSPGSMTMSLHSDGSISGTGRGSAKKKWWKIGRKEGSGDSNGSVDR